MATSLFKIWLSLLPALVAGFVASALANRLIFVVWGLIVAGGQVWLWRGFARIDAKRLTVMLVWLAVSWSGFAILASRYHETFDAAFRAFLPAVYLPFWTAPTTYVGLAILLALGAAAFHWHHRQGVDSH